MTEIRWPVNEKLWFLGRNGYGKCSGLEFSEVNGVIEIRPITSRNQIGRALVSLPAAALPQVLKMLRRLRCNPTTIKRSEA